eukprot:4896452-Pleurochrysis_carterae.AAC.1
MILTGEPFARRSYQRCERTPHGRADASAEEAGRGLTRARFTLRVRRACAHLGGRSGGRPARATHSQEAYGATPLFTAPNGIP